MSEPLSIQKLNQMEQRSVRGGLEFRVCCPFCHNDISFHMYVNLKKGVYHCFKCETSGSIIGLSSPDLQFEKVKYREVESTLSERIEALRVRLPGGKEIPVKEKKFRSLPRNQKLTGEATIPQRLAWDYLTSRGMSSWEILNNDIFVGVDGDGPYSNTVIFAMNLESDDDFYFVCRKMDHRKGCAKYINAPWAKGKVMYTPTKIETKNSQVVILCEGIFDALAINRASGCSVKALLGKKALMDQIVALKNYRNIGIMLDYDAFEFAVKLKMELLTYAASSLVRIIIPPRDKDPGAMTPQEIRTALGAYFPVGL